MKVENIKIRIIEKTRKLEHDYIILDALKNDANPNEQIYLDVINNIKNIERLYTIEEIEANNLLYDIW